VSLAFDRDRVLGVAVNAQAVPASPARRSTIDWCGRLKPPGVARAGGSISPPLTGFLGDFVSAPDVAAA
jgi:hypothetical protein